MMKNRVKKNNQSKKRCNKIMKIFIITIRTMIIIKLVNKKQKSKMNKQSKNKKKIQRLKKQKNKKPKKIKGRLISRLLKINKNYQEKGKNKSTIMKSQLFIYIFNKREALNLNDKKRKK